MRIAALSDMHYHRDSSGKHEDLFRTASDSADVLLLCGDFTDYGTAEEAEVLAEDLRSNVRIPMIGVLGNHDHESGNPDSVRSILEDAGVTILDGESVAIDGIGFAGSTGFGGGFDRFSLNPWGESALKQFVQASIEEALKLEKALARLEVDRRVVLLHYSPVRETVEGECPEIFPFLGSSRLEDPLNHFDVAVAFHGHAHKGSPEGRTATGIPIFNVSIPLLQASYPDRTPFRLVDVQADEPVTAADGA